MIAREGPDGEIGRHSGLKIRRPLSGRGGSSPPPGTRYTEKYVIYQKLLDSEKLFHARKALVPVCF